MELKHDLREIMTFVTHYGLFRYKRLLLEVNSALAQYQYEIQTVLVAIDGQENISDDIIVHSKDQEEHDKCLKRMINRIGELGLILNAASSKRIRDMQLLGTGELLWPVHT